MSRNKKSNCPYHYKSFNRLLDQNGAVDQLKFGFEHSLQKNFLITIVLLGMSGTVYNCGNSITRIFKMLA